MKCNTLFMFLIFVIIYLYYFYIPNFFPITTSTVFVFNVQFFLIKFSRVIIASYCTLFFNFQIVTSWLNLFIICKTLKKEGRAFRNIGKYIYIYILYITTCFLGRTYFVEQNAINDQWLLPKPELLWLLIYYIYIIYITYHKHLLEDTPFTTQ